VGENGSATTAPVSTESAASGSPSTTPSRSAPVGAAALSSAARRATTALSSAVAGRIARMARGTSTKVMTITVPLSGQ